MKLIDRYIMAQYFKFFSIVTSAFIAIYLLIDFFEKIDNFTEAGKPLLAIKFFILNIPFIVDQLSPILILLAGVITLGILNHSRELIALKAGGVPLRTIINPIILSGIICTMLFMAMAQWILPATISMTNYLWYEEVQDMVPLGIHRQGRFYYKGKNGFYSFRWHNPEAYVFDDFSFSSRGKDGQVQTFISASKASRTEKEWLLYRGQIQERQEDGSYSLTIFDEKKFQLAATPDNFFIPENKEAELSLFGLFKDAAKAEDGDDSDKAWARFLGRLSYIFLGLPLLILGLPMLLLSYQRWGRDLSVAIPASCGLAFAAWGIWGALQSLGKAGYIAPLFSAIIVHALFATIGMALLQRQDQQP